MAVCQPQVPIRVPRRLTLFRRHRRRRRATRALPPSIVRVWDRAATLLNVGPLVDAVAGSWRAWQALIGRGWWCLLLLLTLTLPSAPSKGSCA